MDLDAAKQTFIQESQELLDQMEQNLLIMETSPDDKESLGALFRAAHTLKGTAGMFQYDKIVKFIHVVENVLDRARDNLIQITPDLVAILLSCHDHAEKLVEHSLTDHSRDLDTQLLNQGEMLLGQLAAFSSERDSKEIMKKKEELAPQRSVAVEEKDVPTAKNKNWHISLRFESHILKSGLDPYSFIRYLAHLGTIHDVHTLTDEIPSLATMDPMSNYLGFEISLEGKTTKEELEKVFEFVIDDCNLIIVPPRASMRAFAAILAREPHKRQRLLNILIAQGDLTSEEISYFQKDSLPGASTVSRPSSTQPNAKIEDDNMEESDVISEEKPVARSLNKEPNSVSSAPAGADAATGSGTDARSSAGVRDSGDKRMVESRFIRVDAEKLDQMINLVGELVIASASVSDQAGRHGDGKLMESTSLMGRLVSEIRDTTLNIRMVQIGETFNRYRRVVRDLSHEMSKEIELVINGGETELDKTIIEKLSDPLTHLVRNAVDHGIDSYEERMARGKSPVGQISLNAFHETGSIVIEVKDDGAGMKKDVLLKKALEKGLVQTGQQLTDKEIFNLVFHAGFSTAKQVTDVSGRGVGMDVVKRNIEALRGIVDIESEEGKGTTVRIRLPLTLAIIDGFFVVVGRTTWVVPLDMVIECIEFSQKKNGNGMVVDDKEDFINLRGEVLPFLRLAELFGDHVEDGAQKQKNIVVVQYAGQKAGLMVDNLLGEFQTVIKSLGPVFQNLRGISGATIMGSGEVALIIDVPRLVQYAKEKEEKMMAHR